MPSTLQVAMGVDDEAEFEAGSADGDVDPIEEIRLRTWARKNYAAASERDATWHPIILDEMLRKDRELSC